MQQIANSTGETVDLAILQNGQMLFVDQIVGSQRLQDGLQHRRAFPADDHGQRQGRACLP